MFRYDLVWEFVSAIAEQRQAVPELFRWAPMQVVADAVIESHERQRWIEIIRERP